MKPFDPRALRRLALAGILIVLLTLTLREFAAGPRSAPDYDGSERGVEVIIAVASGASGSDIAADLYSADVIKSATAFFRIAVADPRSARIAPGNHRIETRIPAREALEQLLDPERILNLVKVRDGARIIEIAESLQEAGFKKSEIESAFLTIKAPAGFAAKSLEGFLYPAFYAPTSDSTAISMVQDMVNRFKVSTADIKWKYQKFSKHELLTIASLVETEGTPDVHEKVARVIYNRLEKGMPLQLDSTIHYLKKRRGEIQLSIADTKIPSEYNTYLNRGLPPGPIGSPTRASIIASLAPAPGDWLYFVTVSPKQTRFTSSYEEFLQFKAEYLRNFKAGLFE